MYLRFLKLIEKYLLQLGLCELFLTPRDFAHTSQHFVILSPLYYVLCVNKETFFRLLFNCLSWKHTARITISLMFIRTSHIWFYIFIFIYFTIIGYITNSQLTIYPLGFIAQWIEHSTGIAKSWVRVPFKPEFFRLLFQLLKLKAHCEDHNFTLTYLL